MEECVGSVNFRTELKVAFHKWGPAQDPCGHPLVWPKRIVLSDYTITTTKEEKIVRQKLTILNAQKEDEGFYQCNVTDHSNKTNYYEVKINIYEQAQKSVVNFSKSLEVIVKEPGEDVKLVAGYTIFPHSADIGVVWTKDSNQSLLDLKKYKSKTTDSKFILRIFNLTKADSGLYTVTAQAPGGSNQMSFHLHVADKPEVKIINVTGCCYRPGGNYEILCQSEAYPPPVLYWSWKPVCRDLECSGSDEWEVIEDYYEVNNSTVWLTNSNGDLFSSAIFLTAQKSGFYKCSSKNEKGIAEDQIPFIVSDIESGFQIYYDETEPLETSPFSLTCKASLDLFTDLHWRWIPYGQSESIPSYNAKIEKLKSSNNIGISLEIASIKLSDAGKYICVAEKRNENSSEEKSVLINVKEIKEPYFVNPKWNISEMILPPNSVFTLECFVNGTPQPKVTWYRNGELFTENATGGKFEDNYQKLLIGRLMKEDSGEYECRAENIAGEIMQKTMLIVE
ncbi:vascular endothelial growth factor receptor kdr-like, partial [Stegodyphus dumicola]|uniref:vascular endothelial growth factor receptor kdr-like n=1 Tax=Stegodyphus dumicola TaxID=202533 RepID=UPI0015AAED93